ncbi:proline--tRNA ligase [Cohnella rhizosphaerae]|uniref:Proline--tRNA ligase n=1 Tax=Cohnella rhizosphaerae TaxID=1457232 RepID=A0A9X4KVR6_9BACL|nr:proline--tRNA ligase [Cohnella rhizosphaerae]MDG0809529.1 proline--tRNA ligase [Cohnella rhizosphaerae]
MYQSSLFAPTMREVPSDAEAASHRLMLRAGFIRPVASGVYTFLPLGWRVLRKISAIVREELERAGAQEVLMPALQPAELWRTSGRYAAYGPELIRFKDRGDRDFVLGPTHEEVVTALIADEVNSYRQLPMTLYQIQTKFRDERRPRFGLLRGREFLMMDAYSFGENEISLNAAYEAMYEAYERIFARCGLEFRGVEADSGTIGGEGGSHEFMALADVGEDTIAFCAHCGYSANLEKAEVGRREGEPRADSANGGATSPELVHTPGARTIEQLTAAMGVMADETIKTLLMVADGQATAVAIRGDHEANEIKIKRLLGAETLEMADAGTIAALAAAPAGFIGPVGLKLPLWIDFAVADMETGIAGANKGEFHLRGVVPGRDFPLTRVGDLRNAAAGDPCPRCAEGRLDMRKGIEIGHVFKLGTKYSVPLQADFADAKGASSPIVMGCYGIGISRMMSAVAEQHRDDRGFRWPAAVAPFQAHIVPVSWKDASQRALAEELYRTLQAGGVDALLDDRDERLGVKLKDADLFGIPSRIVVGKRAAEGIVEYSERSRPEAEAVSAADAAGRCKQRAAMT